MITFEGIVPFGAISVRCVAVLDRTATTWLSRLLTWLEVFEDGLRSRRASAARCVGM